MGASHFAIWPLWERQILSVQQSHRFFFCSHFTCCLVSFPPFLHISDKAAFPFSSKRNYKLCLSVFTGRHMGHWLLRLLDLNIAKIKAACILISSLRNQFGQNTKHPMIKNGDQWQRWRVIGKHLKNCKWNGHVFCMHMSLSLNLWATVFWRALERNWKTWVVCQLCVVAVCWHGAKPEAHVLTKNGDNNMCFTWHVVIIKRVDCL